MQTVGLIFDIVVIRMMHGCNTLHRKADKYIEKKIHRTNRIIRQGKHTRRQKRKARQSKTYHVFEALLRKVQTERTHQNLLKKVKKWPPTQEIVLFLHSSTITQHP